LFRELVRAARDRARQASGVASEEPVAASGS
jgi:hypothetical protein